jgi:prevent-host-death family protein
VAKNWQLQEARDHFSEVVERALTQGHQVITRHGRPAVVVVAADEFRRLALRRKPLSQFLAESPLRELGALPPRSRDLPREISL